MPEDITKIVIKEPKYHNIQNIVYYIAGAVEILILIRLVFKMTGANPSSGFIAFLYALSGFFVFPFQTIFGNTTAPGAETTAVFEPATLIAIAVYAILAWGIVKLIGIIAGSPHDVE